MAADGANVLELVLVNADKIHPILLELPYEEAGDVLTVGHLARQIEHDTGVEVSNQRLIWRERELKDPKKRLTALCIRNGSRIHMLKHKLVPDDTSETAQLKAIGRDIEVTHDVLSQVIHKVDGIHRGYFPKEFNVKSFTRLKCLLEKCIASFNEELDRLNILDLHHCEPDVTGLRHELVRRIEIGLHRVDGIAGGLDDVIVRMTA